MSPRRSNMTQWMKEMLVLLQVEHKPVAVKKDNFNKVLRTCLKALICKALNDCLGNEGFIANC